MIVGESNSGYIPLERPGKRLPATVSISDPDTMTATAAKIARCCAEIYDRSEHARRSPGKPRICYVTVGTPDYDWGVRVLLRSLRRTTSVPIIILMTSPWQVRTEVSDVYAVEVPTLIRSDEHREREEFGSTYSKLWTFGLSGFDRIVFLDADVLVLKSLDALFRERDFLVCRDSVELANPNRFNSGLLAFTPSDELFDKIKEQAADAHSYDGGDQGLLNSIFRSDVRYMNSEANTLKHYMFFSNSDLNQNDVRAIHYIVKKPWEIWYREITDAFTVNSEDVWTRFLTLSELQALVSQWRRNQFLAERWRFDATRVSSRGGNPLGLRLRHFAAITILAILFSLTLFVAGLFVGRYM
jgi:glycogenin